MPEKERAKASASHAAVDAKLGEQNRGPATCEIANFKLLGEIVGQLRINDLDRNEGEVAKNLLWRRRRDRNFGRGAHRLLCLKRDTLKVVGDRQLAAIESRSVMLATERFNAKVNQLTTQLV